MVNEGSDDELGLGATGASMSEEEKLLKNPSLKRLFNKLLDERIEQANKRGESSKSTLLTELTPPQKGINPCTKTNRCGTAEQQRVVKSPSDTTIYAPVLTKRNPGINTGVGLNVNVHSPVLQNEQMANRAVMNHVSDFVDAARQEFENVNITLERPRRQSEVVVLGHKDVERQVDQTVIEAKRFKAAILPPSGRNMLNMFNMVNENESGDGVNPVPLAIPEMHVNMNQGRLSDPRQMDYEGQLVNSLSIISKGTTDDDFFHLICHIDGNLKERRVCRFGQVATKG